MPIIYDTMQKVQQTTWWGKFSKLLTYALLSLGLLTLVFVFTFSVAEVLFG